MKYLLKISFLIFITNSYSQKEVITFSNSKYSAETNKLNGLLHGKYISKYASTSSNLLNAHGKIRAEGEFKNNIRTGIWKVYDTSGNVIQSREYKNNLEYTRLYPRKVKTGPASLFDTSVYSLKYNAKGFYDYFQLEERMVLYSKRMWRTINATNNKLLFSKTKFYDAVIKFLSDSTQQGYCSKEESFATKMKFSEVATLSSKNYQIISYKIKEDFVYDIDRNLSETRIIGICPVGINKKTKDTSDLCWIYFPYIREELAKHKISDKKNSLIKSMDDLFFFRYFSGDIYKESNIYDSDLYTQSTSEKELKERQTEIEIGLIETEHDIWLGNVPR